MIYFLGDLHGTWASLEYHQDKFDENDTIIQVGDFGFYPELMPNLNYQFPNGYPCKVLVIDGNHEHFDFLLENVDGDNLWEFHPNMFYVPRGTVMEIDGYLIGFLGGACSVDVSWRKPRGAWHWQETITELDLEKLVENVDGRQLDVLVTHAVPPETIKANFRPLDHIYWGLPLDWIDHSSNRVEEAIRILNPTTVVCGHMHKSVKHNHVRILDINEFRHIEDL